MGSRELTPRRIVRPTGLRAEHGVDRPRQFARRGHAGHGPADAGLVVRVVRREPARGRMLHVRDDRPHERTAEPAIGAGGNGPVPDSPLA